jgi:hypothetical protein
MIPVDFSPTGMVHLSLIDVVVSQSIKFFDESSVVTAGSSFSLQVKFFGTGNFTTDSNFTLGIYNPLS